MQKNGFLPMTKTHLFIFSFLFCIIIQAFSLDTFIRINQLGYLPKGIKKAVLLSESGMVLKNFSVYDALTDELIAEYSSVKSYGAFEQYRTVYILDFSALHNKGAFYIRAGQFYSPVIYVDDNVYKGVAELITGYFRQERCGYNPVLNDYCHQHDDRIWDVSGGWHTMPGYAKEGAVTASVVYQMLYASRFYPADATDKFDANGLPYPNNIPDIIDEAKWGVDFLLNLCPNDSVVIYQVGDDRGAATLKLPVDDATDYGKGAGMERSLYWMNSNKNEITGKASVTGKYAAAFALGADVLKKWYPQFADSLLSKAEVLYKAGRSYPGVTPQVATSPLRESFEQNWSDDMQLAAIQLYYQSFNPAYRQEAVMYGRMEPVAPWLFADSVKLHQWYPLLNIGHFYLAGSEDPVLRNEFQQNIRFGLSRAVLRSDSNPFGICVPVLLSSSEYIASLALAANLYRRQTTDSTFAAMETAHLDWLFGCNPWGKSMVVGVPVLGNYPQHPRDMMFHNKNLLPVGAVINGPVAPQVLNGLSPDATAKMNPKENWAVYSDDFDSEVTNRPDFNATASTLLLMSVRAGEMGIKPDYRMYDGLTVVRTDTTKKTIVLAFTAHQAMDGAKTVLKVLSKNNIKASFFVTGDFMRRAAGKSYLKKLLKAGHYVGSYSDRNLQYGNAKDSRQLLVKKATFHNDLKNSYKELKSIGIEKASASYYMPPSQFYNDSIALWTREAGLKLIAASPGLVVNADNSYPEMRADYYSSDELLKRLFELEQAKGLNGFILPVSMGTDSRRFDKFYNKLNELITRLKAKGYTFVTIEDAMGTNETAPKKRK